MTRIRSCLMRHSFIRSWNLEIGFEFSRSRSSEPILYLPWRWSPHIILRVLFPKAEVRALEPDLQISPCFLMKSGSGERLGDEELVLMGGKRNGKKQNLKPRATRRNYYYYFFETRVGTQSFVFVQSQFLIAIESEQEPGGSLKPAEAKTYSVTSDQLGWLRIPAFQSLPNKGWFCQICQRIKIFRAGPHHLFGKSPETVTVFLRGKIYRNENS